MSQTEEIPAEISEAPPTPPKLKTRPKGKRHVKRPKAKSEAPPSTETEEVGNEFEGLVPTAAGTF